MSEAGSRSSGGASETSSQREDRAVLKKRTARNVNGEEDDLLEQNRSLQEGIWYSMYMLARSKTTDSWKWATAKVVLEGLIPFLAIFNPINGWQIQTGNPVWQVVRWGLPRSPVARIWGYDTYIRIFYAVISLVYVTVLSIAVLTFAMRKQEHSKWLRRFAALLQQLTEAVFAVCYISIFDYMVFLLNCKFGGKGPVTHNYWPTVHCMATPHLIHMAVAAVTCLVFFCSTALMIVAACDLNPVARGIMSCPAAVTRLRVLVLKALYVIAVNTLASVPRVQAVACLLAVLFITWFNIDRLTFTNFYINCFWVADWASVTYTCAIFCLFKFNKHRNDYDVRKDMTMYVLYGVFGVLAATAGLVALWVRYRLRAVKKFQDIDMVTVKLRKVHKFGSPDDVEVLSRCMRRFDDDGVVLEEAAALGETVIKCGMAVFPAHVELLVLYANYLMEVKKDGPAARTQLQLALKGGPSLLQRYQIFCTIENSKRLKDGQEGQLDLQSYVEFKRNYRAVIRVHKASLVAQREFWQLMQRSSLKVALVRATFDAMDAAADTAHQVYKRVLERYPNNGKLLRCYGKFLEDVRNDPLAATRAYADAARNGGGDGLLSLDLQVQGGDKPEFLTSMDLHEDACIVINATGDILMVNMCVTALLGYPKTELEGANVNMIMPQPFSGRHASYLTRYIQGGEPHILDTVRDVVALHKERYVFPLQLCVTKLSGMGADCIFLGLLRPAPLDTRSLRAWIAPNGVVLCTDPQFSALTGMLGEDMVGHPFQTLCTDMAAVEAMLEQCREASFEALVTGTIVHQINLVHRHLPPVPVEIKVTQGGTDAQRIFVFNAHRTDGNTDGLMVVDTKGAITFSTWDVAAMLGYPLGKFLKLRIEQLMPAPFATLHATKYLKDQPPTVAATSCRAGQVVNLVNSNNANVAVRLQVTTSDDAVSGRPKHVVQVRKVDLSAGTFHDDKRLVLTVTMTGKIVAVNQPASTLFGFTASAAVGANLAEVVDLFADWREANGEGQLELLLLGLLDRDSELPGTSWRVKVHSPQAEEELLPNIDPRGPKRQAPGRSACMQAEMFETGVQTDEQREAMEHDDADNARGLARIILWRRDLLTGVVAMDSNLVIRKADTTMGLIVGLPASALVRMHLSRVIHVAKGISWDELMQDKKKKSALKGSTGSLVVSPVQAFEGAHPDGGTMRIFMQGVSGAGAARIHATFHADTGFVGTKADVPRALGLDMSGHDGHQQQQQQQQQQQHGAAAPAAVPPPKLDSPEPIALEEVTLESGARRGHEPSPMAGASSKRLQGAEEDDLPSRDGASIAEGSKTGSGDEEGPQGSDKGSGKGSGEGDGSDKGGGAAGGGSTDGAAAHEAARMHNRAHSQSEFVAQWVRTLSKQVSNSELIQEAAAASRAPSKQTTALGPSRAGSRQAITLPDEEGGGGGGGSPRAAAAAGHGHLHKALHGGNGGGASGRLGHHLGAMGLPASGSLAMRTSKKRLEMGLAAVVEEEQSSEDEEHPHAARSPSRGHDSHRAGSGSDGASSQGDDDDNTSQGLGQAFTDASSAVDVDLATDARRARLLKRLAKLFSGPQLADPLYRMRFRTMVLLAIMLFTHVIVYIVFTVLVNSQFANVREVHRLALAADRAQVVVVKAAISEFCSRPGIDPVSVCTAHNNATVADMVAALDDLESYHENVYMGQKPVPRRLKEPTSYQLWTDPSQTYHAYYDTSPPKWVDDHEGVWQLGNRFVASGRNLLYWAYYLQGRIAHLRDFKFLIANGPGALFSGYIGSLDYLVKYAWDEVTKLQTALIALLLAEALVVQLACVLYEYGLVSAVERARSGGLLTSLGLPGPMLRVLANKPTTIVEDSDDEDGDDDDGDGDGAAKNGEGGGGGGGGARRSMDNPGGGGGHGGGGQDEQHSEMSDGEHHGPSELTGAGAQSEKAAPVGGAGSVIGGKRGVAAGVRFAGHGRVVVNGKELLPSVRTTLNFMVPFVLWEVALIVIGVVSYLRLQGMQGPLASLNMASHVIYRYTRVRCSAFLFVAADTPEDRATWRGVLSDEVGNLEDEYQTLMYGGVAKTQAGSVFTHPVPATTFASASFSANFFDTQRCFRWDQSKCYTPDSPYYEVTHHGLDVMMRRILSEMTLLVSDDDADATYNGTRYTTMFMVGVKDLYEGLQSSAQLFVDFSIDRYNSIKMLHTILLVITIVLFVLYGFLLLRPYGAAVEREAMRLAGLLSHVPAEMDVATHVRQVLRAYVRLRGKRGGKGTAGGAEAVDRTAPLLDPSQRSASSQRSTV